MSEQNQYVSSDGKYIGPLSVKGSLDLRHTPIATLPEGLTVGGAIFRDALP